MAKSRLEGDALAQHTHRDPQRLVFVEVLGEPIRRFLRSIYAYLHREDRQRESARARTLLGCVQPWAENTTTDAAALVHERGGGYGAFISSGRRCDQPCVKSSKRVGGAGPRRRAAPCSAQVVIMDNLLKAFAIRGFTPFR